MSFVTGNKIAMITFLDYSIELTMVSRCVCNDDVFIM